MAWNPLVYEDKCYLFKINFSGQICACFTDMMELWQEMLSEEEFLKRFKESNPQFEPTVSEAVNFFQEETSISEVLIRNDEVTCNLNGHVGELKVKYKFYLKKASIDIFVNEWTVPMINTIRHYEAQQNELMKLLGMKDKEISQYEFEKGELIRQDVITKKFDKSSFLDAEKGELLMDVFGKSKEFENSLAKQYKLIKIKSASNQKRKMKKNRPFQPKKKLSSELPFTQSK